MDEKLERLNGSVGYTTIVIRRDGFVVGLGCSREAGRSSFGDAELWSAGGRLHQISAFHFRNMQEEVAKWASG